MLYFVCPYPSVSIIIRTLNEEERLVRLLQSIRNQGYSGEVEVVVVDNESADQTQFQAVMFGAKVVILPRDEFTYPKSLNVGAEAAKGEILVFTVGHALPTSDRWLVSGMHHFLDPDVGGVYSPVIPHKFEGYPKRTLAEMLYYSPNYLWSALRGSYDVKKRGMGVFGATNCAIRRRIWKKHHFNEQFECGGEDGEMAEWIQEHKFRIVCDWRFAVYHSHGLGFSGMREQHRYWSGLGRTSKFSRDKLFFRQDLDFS